MHLPSTVKLLVLNLLPAPGSTLELVQTPLSVNDVELVLVQHLPFEIGVCHLCLEFVSCFQLSNALWSSGQDQIALL